MEIEIQTKTKNPLLNRTEVHFTVQHTGEQTPKRALIKSELAEKLKVKKDVIIVDHMKSHFGLNSTVGYAKVYNSQKEAQHYEKNYLLKRNKADQSEKPKKTKEEAPPKETPEEPKTEKPANEEQPPEPKEETKEA